MYNNDIQKRDEKLIKTESLVKRIINKYKELGYTEVRAYECLEEVIQDMKTSRGSARSNAGLYLYDGPVVSDSNYITRFVDSVVSTSFKTYEFSSSFLLRGNILYLCYYAQKLTDDGGTYIYFNNIWSEITYPDTSTLYL